MTKLPAALAGFALCLLVSCGSSTPGHDGGGGSGGGSGGATGAGGAGGTGTAGTTGTGGGTGSCTSCVACVMTSCASQIAACQANTSCNAIYECARPCTTPINNCVAMHLDAIATWGSTVSTCINSNCLAQCTY
jgi:hypothetical protein